MKQQKLISKSKRLLSLLLSLAIIAGLVSTPSSFMPERLSPFAVNAAATTLDNTNSAVSSSGIITWWGGTETEILIPKEINGITVTGIGDRVFMGKGLTSVAFEPGAPIETIGEQAFQSNELTELALPGTVVSVGEAAFAFNSISTLDLNEGLVTLGENAFRSNTLTAVALPAALAQIPAGAFMLNPGLKSVNLDAVTAIGDRAFFGCDFDDVELPPGLTAYGAEVFAHNKKYVVITGSALAKTYTSPGQFG